MASNLEATNYLGILGDTPEKDYGCVQLTYSLTNTGPEHTGSYYRNHCGARIFRAGIHGINTLP